MFSLRAFHAPKNCHQLGAWLTISAAVAVGLYGRTAGAGLQQTKTSVFSLDAASVTAAAPGDILSAGPFVEVPAAGIPVPPGTEIDALSDGGDLFVAGPNKIFFSVDRNSSGLPGTVVAEEAAGANLGPGDQPADIYGDFRLRLFLDGDGVPNPNSAPGLGLSEPGGQDNVDAFDFRTLSVIGPIYFSTSQAASGGLDPSTIYVVPSPGEMPQVFLSGSELGLVPGDDIDAISLAKFGPDPICCLSSPLLLSLAPGSPTLSTLGASPADVLETFDGFSPPRILFPAQSLGLASTDNIDALEVVAVPEPSTCALAAVGLLCLYLGRPRSRTCDGNMCQ